MDDDDIQSLKDVIEYAKSSSKTEQQHFVSGINCRLSIARQQMMEVKQKFKKDDDDKEGIVAYHGYQSFVPGETTPEIAHEIGIKLATELWGSRHQVVVATHLDCGHIHNHFVLNNVSYIDGHRYNRSKQDYRDMQNTSDRLCHEYGLSVIENAKAGKTKHYSEWKAEREGKPNWRLIIKRDIDEAIGKAMTEQDFYRNLKNLGYEFKFGKDISVRPSGKERYFRLERNFGERYSEECIRERILAHIKPRATIPRQTQRRYTKLPEQTAGGLFVVFRIYHDMVACSMKPETEQERAHFLLKEDHRNFVRLTSEVSLLAKHDIATSEQLAAYRLGLTERIKRIEAARQELRNKARRKSEQANLSELHPQIKQLSSELKKLRKEVVLCDDIEKNSKLVSKKVTYLQQSRKEDDHEQFCGRSRADSKNLTRGN
jgi:hypothetical protein